MTSAPASATDSERKAQRQGNRAFWQRFVDEVGSTSRRPAMVGRTGSA
jgi:hypothetical protein